MVTYLLPSVKLCAATRLGGRHLATAFRRYGLKLESGQGGGRWYDDGVKWPDVLSRLIGKPDKPISVEENSNPWNADSAKSYNGFWLGTRVAKQHINRKTSGNPEIGWLDHFWSSYGSSLGVESRCLILGANEGWIERRLREVGYRGYILATDIADKALARAKAEAEARGYDNIEYRVADLNTDSFDKPFDCIIAEGVLHHIEQTERILRHLHDILAPSGVLFGVEWSGPFRFQLPPEQVRWVNALLAAVPAELRPQYRGPGGVPPPMEYLQKVYFVKTAEADVAKMDPTEAIAGTKVADLVPEIFRVLEWKGFGGTLLSYMGGHFPFERSDSERYVETFVEMMLLMEDKLIESGLFKDEFFAFAAARKS